MWAYLARLAVVSATLLCVGELCDGEAFGEDKMSGPRGLLEAYGIDQSHFDRLSDGTAWHESEDELLLRIMFRLRDFRLVDMEGWAKPLSKMADLAGKPGDHRGELFRLSGRVERLALCQPVAEVVERFQLKKYYRCQFLLGPQREPAILFAEKVPRAWATDRPMDERAGALGMFLKLAGDARQPVPVFVASRVAWYPATVLGELGMDYGLFDDLRPEEPSEDESLPGGQKAQRGRDLGTLRLSARTRECFYQLLSAVGRAKPGQLRREAEQILARSGKKTFSVVPLFNQPEKQQGELVLLEGTVRQVIPVRLSEEDILARFGIRQYYQMFLFTDDSQGNPLVFCVPSLPKGMPAGEDPRYAEHVTVAGFFFNTWAYRSRQSGKTPGQTYWQLAPLLIGQEPVWHPRPQKSSNLLAGVIFSVLFVFALGGIWVALGLSHRGDKQFREKMLARQSAGDTAVSLEQLARQDAGPPESPGVDQGPRPS